MKSRLIILGVFAVFLSALGAVAAFRAVGNRPTGERVAAPPVPVRCITLEQRPWEITASFYGIIRPHARVDMAFDIAGRIVQLGPEPDLILREGDRVSQGDRIAMLDSQRFTAAVQQAQAEVNRARAALQAAESRIREARAMLTDAEREVERLTRLSQRDATTQREVDRAATTFEAAQAVHQSAISDHAAASAAYDSASAALEAANVSLAEASLHAPMDGLVAASPAELGQYVPAGQRVMTLVDNSRVKLVMGIVERKVPLLARGQRVTVHLAALNRQAGSGAADASVGSAMDGTTDRSGIVSRIAPAADPQTGLFHVEVELDNEDGALIPGMVARAVVTVREVTALAIPAEAAVPVDGSIRVFFVSDGDNIAREVELTPIALHRDYYLVEQDAVDWGRLVVEGHSRLTDGQAVHVVEQ